MKIKISKKECLDITLKEGRKQRRLSTIDLKNSIHKDKRTKRSRTRKAKNDKAKKESEE